MIPQDKHFSGLYILEAANGFVVDEGGAAGEYCVGTRWVFRSRSELASWVLNDMKKADFEHRPAEGGVGPAETDKTP